MRDEMQTAPIGASVIKPIERGFQTRAKLVSQDT